MKRIGTTRHSAIGPTVFLLAVGVSSVVGFVAVFLTFGTLVFFGVPEDFLHLLMLAALALLPFAFAGIGRVVAARTPGAAVNWWRASVHSGLVAIACAILVSLAAFSIVDSVDVIGDVPVWPGLLLSGLAGGAVGCRTLREDPVRRDGLRDLASASGHGRSSMAAKERAEPSVAGAREPGSGA